MSHDVSYAKHSQHNADYGFVIIKWRSVGKFIKNGLIKVRRMWEYIKEITVWAFLALLGIIVFFFKTTFKDFRKVYRWYESANADTSRACLRHHDMSEQVIAMNLHIQGVESNSKKYFTELSSKMEGNNKLLLEKINSIIELNKANNGFVKEELGSIKSNLDRVEKSVRKNH